MKTIEQLREEVEQSIKDKTGEWQLHKFESPTKFKSRQANAVLEILFDYVQHLEGRVLDLENNFHRLKTSTQRAK
jgi:hypothetical protein